MPKFLFRILIPVLLLTVSFPASAVRHGTAHKVRVACIGDHGNCPSGLQALLGDSYDVRNFSKSGATMLPGAGLPYCGLPEWKAAREFLPDVAIVMLGRNDTKAPCWDAADYEKRYLAMVDTLRALPSHPAIFVCIPSPQPDRDGTVSDSGLPPVVKRVALRKWLDVIDLGTPTEGSGAMGDEIIAEAMYESLVRYGCAPVWGMRTVFFGDSITDGFWGRKDGVAAASRNHYDLNHVLGHGFQQICAASVMADRPQGNCRFYNRGWSGNGIWNLAARWEEEVAPLRPDVVSILVGINDALPIVNGKKTLKEWEEAYRALLDHVLEEAPDTRFVLCTPFCCEQGCRDRWDGKYDDIEAVVDSMSRAVTNISSDYGCTLVDFNALFKRLVVSPGTPGEHYWMWDGVHPTQQGHVEMSRLWLKKTRKLYR